MTEPLILEMTGRLDQAASPGMESRIGTALDEGPPALVLDFSAVTFVSSIGLRTLLMTAKRCRRQRAKLALHSVPPQIADLFRLSGLTEFFPTYADRAAALKAVV
jgi:anti-anti-sigma factor